MFEVRKKIKKKKIQKCQKLKMVEQFYYQNVLHVTVKKSRFMKEQEARWILSSSALKTPINKIPLFGDILF